MSPLSLTIPLSLLLLGCAADLDYAPDDERLDTDDVIGLQGAFCSEAGDRLHLTYDPRGVEVGSETHFDVGRFERIAKVQNEEIGQAVIREVTTGTYRATETEIQFDVEFSMQWSDRTQEAVSTEEFSPGEKSEVWSYEQRTTLDLNNDKAEITYERSELASRWCGLPSELLPTTAYRQIIETYRAKALQEIGGRAEETPLIEYSMEAGKDGGPWVVSRIVFHTRLANGRCFVRMQRDIVDPTKNVDRWSLQGQKMFCSSTGEPLELANQQPRCQIEDVLEKIDKPEVALVSFELGRWWYETGDNTYASVQDDCR